MAIAHNPKNIDMISNSSIKIQWVNNVKIFGEDEVLQLKGDGSGPIGMVGHLVILMSENPNSEILKSYFIFVKDKLSQETIIFEIDKLIKRFEASKTLIGIIDCKNSSVRVKKHQGKCIYNLKDYVNKNYLLDETSKENPIDTLRESQKNDDLETRFQNLLKLSNSNSKY